MLYFENEHDPMAYVVCVLSRQFWNRGIVTEVQQRVIEYAFEEVGIDCLESSRSVNNSMSGKVMQKAGMILEGCAKQKFNDRTGYDDTHLYAIVAED